MKQFMKGQCQWCLRDSYDLKLVQVIKWEKEEPHHGIRKMCKECREQLKGEIRLYPRRPRRNYVADSYINQIVKADTVQAIHDIDEPIAEWAFLTNYLKKKGVFEWSKM